jgi:(2Fe-2S) ferredoxin
MPFLQRHIFVCTNERPSDNPKGSCSQCGGAAVRDALKAALAERGLNKTIRANAAGCLDQCSSGAAMVVYPEQVWYGKVTVADIPEIVEKHLMQGQIVERLLIEAQPHLNGAVLPTIASTNVVKLGRRPNAE